MSITIKRTGTAVHVLEGAHTLPEGTLVQLFTGEELKQLDQERRTMLDLQMPSFIRGDEDEDAGEIYYLPPSPPLLNDRPLTPMDRLHDFSLNTIRRSCSVPQDRPSPPRHRPAAAGLNQPMYHLTRVPAHPVFDGTMRSVK